MVRFEIVVFLTSSSPFKYVFNQVQAFCFVCGEEQHVFEPFHQCSAHFLGQARRLLGDTLTRACKKRTHLLQFTDITSLLINAFHFFEDTDHNGEERDSCHVPHFCLDKSHPSRRQHSLEVAMRPSGRLRLEQPRGLLVWSFGGHPVPTHHG